MSLKCVREQCPRKCHVLCYLCGENFCREHFNEHDHSLNSILKSLNEQIKDFDDRLEQLNNEDLIENCYEKLDQWRQQAYETIDEFYLKKSRDLQERFQENLHREQDKIQRLQKEIIQLLEEENISRDDVITLEKDVANLADQIDDFEQTIFQIETHPLEIKSNLIEISSINQTHIQFKPISRPHLIIHSSKKSPKPLASNDKHLLTYQIDHLSLLDQQLKILQQIPWNYGRVWDMTYSSTKNLFIILAHYEIYSMNPLTMSIERIENLSRQNWWSCTCSKEILFLSTYEQGSTIFQYQLQSNIQLKKQWKSPLTCSIDESIKDMFYQNNQLALTIFNQIEQTKRFELRSIDRFECLWTYQFDTTGPCYNSLRCCSLNNNQWLIADFDQRQLIHLNSNGKLKSISNYNLSPWYLNLFNGNLLVISTRRALHFHRLDIQ